MTAASSNLPRRSERINLRVDSEVDELLRSAADLEHLSLSAFMVNAALERARRTVEANHRWIVSAEAFGRALEELEQPAQVVDPLLDLARRVADRKHLIDC